MGKTLSEFLVDFVKSLRFQVNFNMWPEVYQLKVVGSDSERVFQGLGGW